MKKIKIIIKKILFILTISIEIAALMFAPVQAFSLKPKSPPLNINANGIAQQLEKRYHVNKESVQNSAEEFNVSAQKIPAPEVDLFFNPTNPKFGEKATVTAIPKYFQEGKENMYFTWYIKHKGCELGLKAGDSNWKATCDTNSDGIITADDWKAEAMRNVANGGYIKEKADYSSDNDNDGFRAHKGGRVNIQKTDYCYIHDFASGENYEVATTDHESGEDSDSCAGGKIICSNDVTLTCGFEYTSTNGTSSSTTTGGSTSGSYEETTMGSLEKYYKTVSNSGYDPTCDLETDKMTCPDETIPVCVKNEDMDLVDPTCDQFILCPENPEEGTDCYKLRHGFATTGVSCESEALSADQIDLKCEHQFAKISGFTVGDGSFGAEEERFWGTDPHDPSTIDNDNNDEANVAGLGMDKMTWSFEPGDKVGVIVEGQSYLSTKHDDASVATSFALINNIFDKQGTDCEIESGLYQQNIKGYDVKIPFANVDINACLEYNLTSPTDGSQADNMEITLDYYPKNPNIGSLGTDSNGKSKGGDPLTITSNTSDPNVDVNQIYYKWSIYGFKGSRNELSLDREAWTLLSDNDVFRKANNIKLLEGLGMDTFEMQLNTTTVNGVNYNFLRFFVESEEFYDTGKGTTGTTRSGRGDILVEPNQSGSGGISISIGSTPICEDNGVCEVLENQVVTATLGETAAGSGIGNYLWTLDGKNINTLNEGEIKQGNSVTFLLEGRPGDTHVLSMIANDTAGPAEVAPGQNKNKGEKLTLSKNFVVSKPMVGIGPNNKINRGSEDLTECMDLNGNVDESAVVGTYSTVVDPQDPNAEPETVLDCKESVFNGSGSVTITPTYYPEWIRDNLKNVKYSINGKSANDNPNGGCSNISCTIDLSAYPAGSRVNISFSAEYWQTDAQRVDLKNWGVTEGQSSGIKISDSIMVKVGEPGTHTIVKGTSKIIAGLAHNMPEQMIFMFRLVLTAATVVFAAGVIMSLGQKKYE